MKIHSLKLTIQDMKTSDDKDVAAVMGTVFIEDGEFKKNEDGNIVLDDAGDPIPIYETINFTTALHTNRELKRVVQELIIEAVSLKNLEIAKENGTLSHYLKAMTTLGKPKLKRGTNREMMKVRRKKK